MSEEQDRAPSPSAASTVIPFEAVPELAANEDWINAASELRELKERIDRDTKRFEALKLETAAAAIVAGVKSVAFLDLRITTADGGVTKGKVTGAALVEQYEQSGKGITQAQLRAIALAAKDCDIQALVDGGIGPLLIAAAKSPDKPRAASVRVEWIGAKGKGGKEQKDTGGDPS